MSEAEGWGDLDYKQKTGIAVVPTLSVFVVMFMNWNERVLGLQGGLMKTRISAMGDVSKYVVPLGDNGVATLLMIFLFVILLLSVSLNFLPSTKLSKIFNSGLYFGVGVIAVHHATVAYSGMGGFTAVLLFIAVMCVDRINEIYNR